MATELFFGHREIHGWISQRSGLVWVEDFCGIAEKNKDGQIVAAVGYDHHQFCSAMFHIATDRPLSRTLLWRAFQVPFEQWSYEVLFGVVQHGNEKSRNIAEHLGFTAFHQSRGAHPSGALVFYEMRREDCKWLKRRKKSVCAGSNERRKGDTENLTLRNTEPPRVVDTMPIQNAIADTRLLRENETMKDGLPGNVSAKD